jgi:hypothetical protein
MLLLAFGAYYFGHFFSDRYLPPNIIVTKNEIISSGGFMNPITIEKLKVVTFGKEKRPTKYTIEYVTTCTIKQKDGEPPVALKEIKLNEPGRYSWTEENVDISISHPEGLSKRIDSTQRLILSTGHELFDTCPLKFENDNWYFVNFQDPVITGIYVYADNNGVIHQYVALSGISPV